MFFSSNETAIAGQIVTVAIALLITAPRVGATQRVTTIDLTYTFVADRLRPEPRADVETARHVLVTLSEGGHVDESLQGKSGEFSESDSRSARLGQTVEGAQFHVLGPDRLRRTVKYPQGLEIDTISVIGQTCEVGILFKLSPGYREFAMHRLKDGTLAFWSQPRVT
jgi:hypothetical protein